MKVLYCANVFITFGFFYLVLGLNPINETGVLSLKIFCFVAGIISGVFIGMTVLLKMAKDSNK